MNKTENNKRPRRDAGRGILDIHPTQLRRGGGTDINPEQLHIIDIKPEIRIAQAEEREHRRRTGEIPVVPKNKNTVVSVPKSPAAKSHVSIRQKTAGIPVKIPVEKSDIIKSEFVKNTGLYTQPSKNGTVAEQNKKSTANSIPVPEKTLQNTVVREMHQSPAVPEKTLQNDNVGISGARRILNLILCALFMGTVVFGGLFSVLHMADKDRSVYSEFEKRNLEKAPEISLSNIADGSYTENFDKFYSDNFPIREELVKSATFLKRFRGIRAFKKDANQMIRGDIGIYADGEMEILIDENKFTDAPIIKIPGLDDENSVENTVSGENGNVTDASQNMHISSEYVPDFGADSEPGSGQLQSPETSGGDEQNTESGKEEASGELKGDKRDTIYIIGDTAYEYFRGSIKSNTDYINVINTYAKYIPKNVNIFTMVIPTHPEFGLTGADRTVSNDQKPVLDHIGTSLDKRITYVNPYNKLSEAYKKGEYLYFRTDHHWTIRGAYLAYLEFCEKAGIIPFSEDQYEKGRVEPFLGTFYSASKQEPALAANPDYVEYFEITQPCTVTRYDKNDNMSKGALYYRKVRGEANAYLAFMGGDFPYVNIKTENKNGRKLMIFKESFGNPLIGLLTPHFEEIHVADIRYFKYNSVNFISQYGITDVLFCNGIMSANSKARVNDLMNLMNK